MTRNSPSAPDGNVAPKARRPLIVIIQALLLGLSALEFAALLVPPWREPLNAAAAALLAIFLPFAFIRARRTTRVLFILLSIAVGLAAYHVGDLAPIWHGLRNAVLLGAFLCVLQFLRTVTHAGPAIGEVRRRLAPLDGREAEGCVTVGAFGLGSFLSFGAHAVLAPLLPPDVGEKRRIGGALASIRGICFAAFWSPFFVGVAFVTHRMDDVGTGAIMALGIACATASLLIDLAVSGTGPRGLARIPRSLAPLLPVSAAIAAVFAVIAALTGMSAMGTVVVGVPLVAGALLFTVPPKQAPGIVKSSLDGMVYGGDELLLVTAANVFAAVLTQLPGFLPLVAPILNGLPTFPLLLTAMGLMLGAGAFGFHPAISAAVLLGVFDTLPDSVNRLALAQALIMGWSLAVTISPVGVTVMVAGQMFQVPYPKLIVSRNLITALTVTVAASGALSLLDLLAR